MAGMIWALPPPQLPLAACLLIFSLSLPHPSPGATRFPSHPCSLFSP